MTHSDIQTYNDSQLHDDKAICDALMHAIIKYLPKSECKIRHAHPVRFLDGNPIVGYSKLKGNVRLLFWSGQSFDEQDLKPEGKFKAAQVCYTSVDQIDTKALKRWLDK